MSKNQQMAMDDLNKEEEVQIRLAEIVNQIKTGKREMRHVQYDIMKFEKIEKE